MSEVEFRADLGGLADLERRTALAISDGRLPMQDQFDWVEALLDMDCRDDARLLLQSIAIRQGFSRQAIAVRRNLSQRADLPADAASAPVRTGNTVELAIAELRALAAKIAPSMAEGLANRPRRDMTPGLHPSAVLRRPASRPSQLPVRELVAELFDWLLGRKAQVPQAAIDALRGAEGEGTIFHAATLAGAAPPLLAAAISLQELRFFLRTSCDLLSEPFGSPQLFHATAALDSAGLGPYFGNVGQIVRRSANLFELAAIAEEASGTPVGKDIWAVLLARNVNGALLGEFVDDLADAGASAALQIVLARALAWPTAEMDMALLMRIRDAALDNLDYDLAGNAQRAIARLKPDDWAETFILGTIDASGGRVMAADQSFIACLEADPTRTELRNHLEANRTRRYDPLAVVQGFGSPHDRQLRRLRRRSVSS